MAMSSRKSHALFSLSSIFVTISRVLWVFLWFVVLFHCALHGDLFACLGTWTFYFWKQQSRTLNAVLPDSIVEPNFKYAWFCVPCFVCCEISQLHYSNANWYPRICDWTAHNSRLQPSIKILHATVTTWEYYIRTLAGDILGVPSPLRVTFEHLRLPRDLESDIALHFNYGTDWRRRGVECRERDRQGRARDHWKHKCNIKRCI